VILVSIVPGAPSRVRVYVCSCRSRKKILDVKFSTTPDVDEARQIQHRPMQFVADTEAAA
jgi:hypothetical protein